MSLARHCCAASVHEPCSPMPPSTSTCSDGRITVFYCECNIEMRFREAEDESRLCSHFPTSHNTLTLLLLLLCQCVDAEERDVMRYVVATCVTAGAGSPSQDVRRMVVVTRGAAYHSAEEPGRRHTKCGIWSSSQEAWRIILFSVSCSASNSCADFGLSSSRCGSSVKTSGASMAMETGRAALAQGGPDELLCPNRGLDELLWPNGDWTSCSGIKEEVQAARFK